MPALTLDDVLSNADFVAQRPRLLTEIMRSKALRRIAVGPHMTLLFENRDSVLWQVHEMCRVEGISKPAAIQDELDAYNPILTSQRSLSATLMVEYPDEAERKDMLVKLSGLSRHFWLKVEGSEPLLASFEAGREKDTGKISSVQFLRFELTTQQRDAFMHMGKAASFVVDHPAYTAEHTLSGAERGALIDDLQAG